MKFILPTQHAPDKKIQVGELKISPSKRVFIERGHFNAYWDSMVVELVKEDWKMANEWLAFHNIIFRDQISLDWYESQNFDTGKLNEVGECAHLLDYLDISKDVYFPYKYPSSLNYGDLYKIYVSQTEENKSLVKNYFNSFESKRINPLQRNIRNDSFLRILILFSIIESIIGENPTCSNNLTCSLHSGFSGYKHHLTPQKEWINMRLLDITSNFETAKEYFSIIWEVRQKIRHKTVHEGAISEAQFVQQDEGEIVWDWVKTSKEWEVDSTALLNLKIQISDITRNLLLNKLFSLTMFPKLRPLHSTRIEHRGDIDPNVS